MFKDQPGMEELKQQKRIVDDLLALIEAQQKKSTSDEVDDNQE